MTLMQASKLWRCSDKTLRKIIQLGLVPGTEKRIQKHGAEWFIPDDAVNPLPAYYESRKKGKSGKRPAYEDASDPEQFFRLNCGHQSIRWIARTLGITPSDVRAMYDRLLKEGGDDVG